MEARTQWEKVLWHLLEHGSITADDALAFKCYRLSAVIWTLKHKAGFNIETERVPTAKGKGTYAVYHISPEDRENYKEWKEIINA